MVVRRIQSALRLTRSRGIARRYFVVNGFDGALTMLGIVSGFHFGGEVALPVVLNAAVGATVALTMSGLTSAYISERAERRRALQDLEEAMVTELEGSSQAEAARWAPVLIAAVNGLAPMLLCGLILLPVLLAHHGVTLPGSPLVASIAMGLTVIFGLGVFLGRVGRVFWLVSGVQTLAIAVVTIGLIRWIGL